MQIRQWVLNNKKQNFFNYIIIVEATFVLEEILRLSSNQIEKTVVCIYQEALLMEGLKLNKLIILDTENILSLGVPGSMKRGSTIIR